MVVSIQKMIIGYLQIERGTQYMMTELNKIWKEKTGKDLTEAEAWKMVEFVQMILENADKNIDKEQKRG